MKRERQMDYCPRCGRQLKQGAGFCTSCGTKISPYASDVQPTPVDIKNLPTMSLQDVDKLPLDYRDVLTEIQKKHMAVGILFGALLLIGVVVTLYFKYHRFEKPVQYMVLSDGAVMSTNRRICKYDTKGKKKWCTENIDGTAISWISGFDIDAGGNIILFRPFEFLGEDYDSQKSKEYGIEILSPSGKHLRSIGDSMFSEEFYATAGPNGDIASVDTENNTLYLFLNENKGRPRIKGIKGSKPGEFDAPTGIAFMKDGSLLVSDAYNARIQHFTPRLTPLKPWLLSKRILSPGSKDRHPIIVEKAPGKIKSQLECFPKSIVVDNKRGRVYIAMLYLTATAPSGHIAVFDMSGNFIENKILKSSGGGTAAPCSMKMTPAGKISVVDWSKRYFGEWNPDDNEILKQPSNTGVNEEFSKLNSLDKKHREITSYGIFVSVIAIIGLICFTVATSTMAKRQMKDHSKRNPVPRTAPASAFQADNSIDPQPEKYAWMYTIPSLILLICCLAFALWVITSPKQFLSYHSFHLLSLFIQLIFFVTYFPLCTIAVKKGYLFKTHTRRRDTCLKKNADVLSKILLKNERIIDALPIGFGAPNSPLLVLTNQRLLKTEVATSVLFSNISLSNKNSFPATFLKEIVSVNLKESVFFPSSTVTIDVYSGTPAKVQTGYIFFARSFIKKVELLRQAHDNIVKN